jgi:hypothetical protein
MFIPTKADQGGRFRIGRITFLGVLFHHAANRISDRTSTNKDRPFHLEDDLNGPEGRDLDGPARADVFVDLDGLSASEECFSWTSSAPSVRRPLSDPAGDMGPNQATAIGLMVSKGGRSEL